MQQDRVNVPALVAILLGVVLATLDTAIANTALPAMAADLRTDPGSAVWIINAYQLSVVAVLLPFAALADSLGPRKVFIFGLSFFTAASLACVLSQNLLELSCARVLQGIGGGALMSVNVALIRLVYPPTRLGRGLGFNALVVGIGFAIGPTVASLVLSIASWPWLFGLNVPLGALATVVAFKALPRPQTADAKTQSPDIWTALLTAISFAAAALALIEMGQLAGWQRITTAAAVALVFGTLLMRRQKDHAAPMLPVDLLRRPMFALSCYTAFASFATQGLAFVSLPFYFEHALQRNPIDTGFLMTSWPVAVAAAAPIAGRLSDRYPPGLLGGVGLLFLCVGMLLLAQLSPSATALHVMACMAICGVGFGFFQSPNLRAIMTSAPAHRSGGASGMVGIVRLVGQATGAALVALCFGLQGLSGTLSALYLGAAFALMASVASFSRLIASNA